MRWRKNPSSLSEKKSSPLKNNNEGACLCIYIDIYNDPDACGNRQCQPETKNFLFASTLVVAFLNLNKLLVF